MKKALLTGVAALFLATGTAYAGELNYRPQYDTRPWEAEPPLADVAESDEVLAERCMNGATFWCDALDERIDKKKAAKRYKLTAKDLAGWAKWCGPKNERCDPTDAEDNNWGPPPKTQAEADRILGPRPVEIPKQYRGAWCETKWSTIYKRCSAADFEITRTYWTTVESTCTVLAIHKSKYGGHRLVAKCEADEGSRDMPKRAEARWWLGTNNTRLQAIIKNTEYD
jgi:hypothetical protein